MISCASLWLLQAAVSGAASVPAPPAAFVDQVRADVAARWRVTAADVTLEWGQLPRDIAGAGATVVRLSNGGVDGWFVATASTPDGARAVSVRAGVAEGVPIAARALAAGARLAADDIRWDRRVRWGPPRGAMPEPLGWEVRRDLRVGDKLASPAVAPPRMVTAGAVVRAIWEEHGVRVEKETVALESARLGEVMRVRAGNASLKARVIGPDTVRIERGPP